VSVRLPRRTVRLRLTLLYGSLFLACGAALLAITYFLVKGSTSNFLFVQHGGIAGIVSTAPAPGSTARVLGGTIRAPGGVVRELGGTVRAFEGTVRAPIGAAQASGGTLHAASGRTLHAAPSGLPVLALPAHAIGAGPLPTPEQAQAQAQQFTVQATLQHNDELHQLLVQSGIALAIMAAVAMGLGWIVAGRALRPLRTITAAARRISATSLHERLVLDGPDDELTELGRTFNELLARLEDAFSAQRQFVANASHELRTPLTLQRALLEVALADPHADSDSLRAACLRNLAAGEQLQELIEALLTLAGSERSLQRREPVELATVIAEILRTRCTEIERRELRVNTTLASAPIDGDPRLIERLVANLLDNALRYNVVGGLIEVASATEHGRGTLSVSNTGPLVPAQALKRLFQPFQRLAPDRAAGGEGHGLGLSIVQAIAVAHGAAIDASVRRDGGLAVTVCFSAPAAPAGTRTANSSISVSPLSQTV
jgi:signal transduction histidine kinase